jgi:RNA polymerase sigma-70 factor (ECF subfamily)
MSFRRRSRRCRPPCGAFAATSISRRLCSRSRSSARAATSARRCGGGARWAACLSPRPRAHSIPKRDSYRRQLAARLAAALDEIPLKLRLAFVLCEVEGLTAVQAAAVAGVPAATVRTRLFHARRKLRALLALEHAE